MATQQEGFDYNGKVAGEDLSSSQFLAVYIETDGDVNLAATTGRHSVGILQNAPGSGEACSVRVTGLSLAMYGGTVDEGDALTCETTTARLITTTTATHYVLARELTAGADGDIREVLITHEGREAAA